MAGSDMAAWLPRGGKAFISVKQTDKPRAVEVARKLVAQGFDTFALVDLDRFKAINDLHGHQVGDAALIACASAIRATGDRDSIAVRLGGEEFVVLLPDTDLVGAQAVAEKLAVRLREHPFVAKGQRFQVSMSLGVVQYTGGDPDQALRVADRNLSAAKARGRDCIVASMVPQAA